MCPASCSRRISRARAAAASLPDLVVVMRRGDEAEVLVGLLAPQDRDRLDDLPHLAPVAQRARTGQLASPPAGRASRSARPAPRRGWFVVRSPSSLSKLGTSSRSCRSADDADRLLAQLARVRSDQGGVDSRAAGRRAAAAGPRSRSTRSSATRSASASNIGGGDRAGVAARLSGPRRRTARRPAPRSVEGEGARRVRRPRVDAQADPCARLPLGAHLGRLGRDRHLDPRDRRCGVAAPARRPRRWPDGSKRPLASRCSPQLASRGTGHRAAPRRRRAASGPRPPRAREARFGGGAGGPVAPAGAGVTADSASDQHRHGQQPGGGPSSQHLGEHEQVVPLTIEVRDRADALVSGPLVETGRPPCPSRLDVSTRTMWPPRRLQLLLGRRRPAPAPMPRPRATRPPRPASRGRSGLGHRRRAEAGVAEHALGICAGRRRRPAPRTESLSAGASARVEQLDRARDLFRPEARPLRDDCR